MVEIYLYKKNSSRIHDQIFVFENLNEDLTEPLKREVYIKRDALNQLNFRNYNPLVKDREYVDTINIENLKENSTFFKNIHDYFADTSEEIDTVLDINSSYKYSLMIYKIHNEIFIKQFDGNKLLSETSLIGEFDQQVLQKTNKKLLMFDGNFDFYFNLEETQVIIKNSSRFEKICNYEAYFDRVRGDKIVEIGDSNIISNFDEIYDEINNKKYNRLFTQLNTFDIGTITSNTTLINRLESKDIFFLNNQFEIRTPEHSHILLFLISGLVSINNFDQVVVTKDQELIIDREANRPQQLARL
ncbi:hypothetical protein [Bacillus mycoides]|uniref:hypothetical protein n=1 Tax=Bacillus mycoides TaxID=1405 RepID=UPI003557495C